MNENRFLLFSNSLNLHPKITTFFYTICQFQAVFPQFMI